MIWKRFLMSIKYYPQDAILNKAQEKKIVCADNGIFKGVPISKEQQKLTEIAKGIEVILEDYQEQNGLFDRE